AQHLNPGQPRRDPFGQLKRVRFARAEAPGRVDCFAYSFADVRVAMTENQRTKALAKIDVLAAINGSHPGALRAAKEDRRAADAFEGAHRTVHTARRDASRTIEQLLRKISSGSNCLLRGHMFSLCAFVVLCASV